MSHRLFIWFALSPYKEMYFGSSICGQCTHVELPCELLASCIPYASQRYTLPASCVRCVSVWWLIVSLCEFIVTRTLCMGERKQKKGYIFVLFSYGSVVLTFLLWARHVSCCGSFFRTACMYGMIRGKGGLSRKLGVKWSGWGKKSM